MDEDEWDEWDIVGRQATSLERGERFPKDNRNARHGNGGDELDGDERG